ncbi:MAG: glutamate formimidoyltransferase [Fermentimonas sp.]|jgi:glutamate formiminotransferase
MNKIIECVPNFSEGRDATKIEIIVDAFRNRKDVKILDYSSDKDHNRSVVSVVGSLSSMKEAVIDFIGKAIELIDLNKHSGEHPRIGAVDVVPFIPIKNVTMDEAIAFSKEVAEIVAEKYDIPVYLYEKSSNYDYRRNLATIRKGEFEGLSDKIKMKEWYPDYGPDHPHPTAGAVVIGARGPLIAYNVNLDTTDIEIARSIAKKVRHIGGGLRYCKAMGVELKELGVVQVSMNLTDYTGTSIYQAHEMVRMEAKRFGVNVLGGEVIGLVPVDALVDVASYYLGLKDFSANQILEMSILGDDMFSKKD